MKRKISKKTILLVFIGICVLGVCTCGDNSSAEVPVPEESSEGLWETDFEDVPEKVSTDVPDTILEDSEGAGSEDIQDKELPVLGIGCSLSDFADQPRGMEFVFSGVFWSTRKDDYGYNFSYKEHNENGSTTSQEFFVKDDTEDKVLSALDDKSDRGKAAVKMEVVFNKTEFWEYEGNDTIRTIYYVTAKKAEILDSTSAEAKKASGDYYMTGESMRFTNGLVVKIVDTGKYVENYTSYAYVEIEAENQGDSEVDIGSGSAVFYGDDYRLTYGYPVHSDADNLSGVILSPGRKNRGRIYALCEDYDSLSRIEMEFNDNVIIIKGDLADSQAGNLSGNAGQVSRADIDYPEVYNYAFDEINMDNEYGSYCLWDLDENGIYELILGHGENSADYVHDIWTVGEEGSIVRIGNLYGDHLFYVAPDENGLYAVYGNMGYESVTRITLEDGKMVEELISERELGPDDEYYSSEMEIFSAALSDRSLLERICD